MGQLAPRVATVSIPVGQEVVAAVVPDLRQRGVHGSDLANVRRVQDDLATVGDDRLDLVEALGPRPQVGIPTRHQGEHPPDRSIEVLDVRLRRHVRRGRPRGRRLTEGQRLRAAGRVVNHDAERVPLTQDELRGSVDQRARPA